MSAPKPWFLLPLLLAGGLGAWLGWTLRGPGPLPSSPKHQNDSPPPLAPASPAGQKTPLDALRPWLDLKDAWKGEVGLHDHIESLAPKALESLALQVLTLPVPQRDRVLRHLLRRLAVLDPRAALAVVPRIPGEGKAVFRGFESGWRGLVLSECFANEPSATRALVDSLPSGDEKNLLLHVLSTCIARTNPAEALCVLAASSLPPYQRDQQQGEVYAAWAGRDPQAAATSALALPPGNHRSNCLKGVAGAWAVTDPAAALAWATSLDNPTGQPELQTAVLSSWITRDPQAAWNAASTLKSPSLVKAISRNLAQSWGSRDPLAALAWDESLPRESNRKTILSAWVARDPEAAQAWVAQLAENDRPLAQFQLIGAMLEGDNVKGRRMLEALPSGWQRDKFIMGYAANLAQHDFAGTLKLLEGIPPGAERENCASMLTQNVPNSDPALADRLLNLLADRQKDMISSRLAERLASADLATGLAWSQALPVGEARTEAILATVDVWAKTSPKDAFDWMIKNEPSLVGKTAQGIPSSSFGPPDAFTSWTQSAPDEVISWLGGLPAGPARDRLMSRTVQNLATSDVKQAADLLATTFPANPPASALAAVAREWSRQDPAEAAAWAAQVADPKARAQSLKAVVSEWATTVPAEAATWAGQLTDPAARAATLAEVSRQWSTHDPEGASAWLNKLPAGPERDPLVLPLVENLTYSDPEAASIWAASLTDARKRADQVAATAREWLKLDPAAAKAWLDKTDSLPPDRINKLLGK